MFTWCIQEKGCQMQELHNLDLNVDKYHWRWKSVPHTLKLGKRLSPAVTNRDHDRSCLLGFQWKCKHASVRVYTYFCK